MDIEELNTTQVILLVLLVSFVTSIATGIVTVSLLAQAPPAVTQTVNHVVERTIETVVPKDGGSGTVVTKETTVVVKEEELITKSIADSFAKTGRVFSGTSTSSPVVALAVPIAGGALITDSSVVTDEHMVLIDGTSALFKVARRLPEAGIAVLAPKSASTTVATAFRLADFDSAKLGSTAIAIVSIVNERVALAPISARVSIVEGVRAIDTEMNDILVPGAPLVNVFGDLLGISTVVSRSAGGAGAFVAASDVARLLATPAATSTPQ